MSWESTPGSMCEPRLSQPSRTAYREPLWDPLDGWGGLGGVHLESSPASQFVLGASSSAFPKLFHFWDAASGPGSLPVRSHIHLVQQIGVAGESKTPSGRKEVRNAGAWEIFTPWSNNNFSGQGSTVSVVPLLDPDTCLISDLLLIQS